MNEVIERTIEKQTAPWARSKEDWNTEKHHVYTTRQQDQLREMTPMFAAYCAEKSAHNENKLAKWIMDELAAAARREYKQALGNSRDFMLPEIAASRRTSQLCARLKKGHYESSGHLLGDIGSICKHFYSDAIRDVRQKARQIKMVSLFVEDEDGNETPVFEVKQKPQHRIGTPCSDDNAEVERQARIARATKRALVNIVPTVPRDRVTRENLIFYRWLNPQDADLFRILEDCDWNRSEAARLINQTENTVDQNIKRIGLKFQELRELARAFRLPVEHPDDLTDRLVRFVSKLQTVTKSARPKSFTNAFVLCAHDADTRPDEAVLYDAHEVISHLVKLWKAHMTQ